MLISVGIGVHEVFAVKALSAAPGRRRAILAEQSAGLAVTFGINEESVRALLALSMERAWELVSIAI